ncbi:unnamed protein product [Merluccius merluccius]
MDGECVKLLPQVCEVLAVSGESLPDDTSLEKLLDWFSGLNNTGKYLKVIMYYCKCLLEVCPCLPEFISAVIRNPAPDPGVLSFAFKLTGLLAATERSFTLLQEDSLRLGLVFDPPHRWREAGFWEDPCVRIGWVQGLGAMLQHSPALHFLVETDLTKVLLQLQTDTSLFVAAAANDVLAHILVNQSLLSEKCVDTKGKENSSVRETVTVEADIQRLALTLGTSHDYATVTMAILEHVKVSLVSKESKERHQTLQTLRLLILIFGQARAPLLGVLLKTVSEPLEALVAEGDGLLTLPLMDVLLTACRYPDEPDAGKTASSLIYRMLDTYKPPEVIHAGASLLRRDHHDSNHKATAAGLLLLPLEMITGLTVPGTQSAAEQRSSLAELMNSKTPCVSLLCVCLTHATRLTCTLPDVPIGSLVTVVLSLLRICSGQAPSSPIGSAKACRNLIGCGKVQRCSLEALMALAVSPGAAERMSEVFSVLIQYLDNPDSEPTVLHKSYQTLLKWISVCPDPSSTMRAQQGQDLLTVVRKRVCDVRWEVRDSTVEFLGELAALSHSKESALCAYEDSLGCSITPHLAEALQDPESYVRASAITALAQTFTPCWQQGAAPRPEQVVNRLLEILSGDTEGFPRRAAVRYFTYWFSLWNLNAPEPPSPPSSSSSSSPPLLTTSVCSVLSLGSADLDWEVKVHTLELARLLLCRALSPCSASMSASGAQNPSSPSPQQQPPPHPYAVPGRPASHAPHSQAGAQWAGSAGHGETGEVNLDGVLLAGLVEQGVLSVLLSGLFDCDRPVALKACGLLMNLRDAVCPPPPTHADHTAAGPSTVATVTCELQGCDWGREVEALLERACDRTGAEANGRKGADSKSCDWTKEKEEGRGGVSVRVCDVLRSLDLDDRLAVLTQSSDHVQNSPLSLLQDILSVGDTRAADPNAQEVIVDCY